MCASRAIKKIACSGCTGCEAFRGAERMCRCGQEPASQEFQSWHECPHRNEEIANQAAEAQPLLQLAAEARKKRRKVGGYLCVVRT